MTALLRDNKLYISWLGDSQMLLVRAGRPVQIMVPHKPEREVRVCAGPIYTSLGRMTCTGLLLIVLPGFECVLLSKILCVHMPPHYRTCTHINTVRLLVFSWQFHSVFSKKQPAYHFAVRTLFVCPIFTGIEPPNCCDVHVRQDERQRIEDAGGFVVMIGTWRVNAALSVSRAIGTACYIVASMNIIDAMVSMLVYNVHFIRKALPIRCTPFKSL